MTVETYTTKQSLWLHVHKYNSVIN